MKEFKKFLKISKILILVAWFFSVIFLTIGLILYFYGEPIVISKTASTFSFLLITFIGCFVTMTPIFFFSVFGEVWLNGIESLEEERFKLEEEIDKYIGERKKLQKWLQKQIEKDQ